MGTLFDRNQEMDDFSARELAREKEERENETNNEKQKIPFSEYVGDNKVFFIACAVSLLAFVGLIIGLLKGAPTEFMEVIAVLLVISIITENLFNPLHRNMR